MKLSEVQKRQMKGYFQKRPEVVAVYVYGSQTKGRAGPLSDVDVGVLLKNDMSQEKELDLQLEYIRAVQVVTQVDLSADVKLLDREKPLLYLAQVIRDGELLVVNDRRQHREFVHRIGMLFPDFYPVLKNYFARMSQRLKEGRYASG